MSETKNPPAKADVASHMLNLDSNPHSAYVPFIPVGFFGNMPTLACPYCNWICVYPTAIEVNPPGSWKGKLRIDVRGVHLDPTKEPVGRGVEIVLHFACECDHEFTYRLHFHKGQTYVERETRPMVAKCYNIWRS